MLAANWFCDETIQIYRVVRQIALWLLFFAVRLWFRSFLVRELCRVQRVDHRSFRSWHVRSMIGLLH